MPWPEVSIVSSRLEFVTLAMSDEVNIRVLCRRFGVCPSTAYKWIRRYERDGPAGLEDQSRRPHYSPKRTPKNIESQILAVRDQHPSWGGRKIQDILLKKGISSVPSPSTITEILRRNGRLDPAESEKNNAMNTFRLVCLGKARYIQHHVRKEHVHPFGRPAVNEHLTHQRKAVNGPGNKKSDQEQDA